MNLRFLETFIWVAKLGSFRAAANQLHLTQAAISRRIASLESELGQLLFERSNRNIQLTSAGYHLLRFSNQVLNLERDLLADFQGKLALRGRVRLGIVESIVHTWFNSFISELHRTHPDIELELTVEPSRRLSDLLMQGLLDVALQTDPILAEGIRNVPVGGLKMGLVIAAGNEPKEAVDIKTLTEQWPIVTFPRNSQPHLELMEVLEEANVSQPRIHFVSSIAASMELMAAGICMGAVLSAWITTLGLSQYALIVVLTVFFILLGAFLDGISLVVLTTSVLMPTVLAAGIDPIWFGVYLILTVEMAQITPPIGFNLFVLQNITERNLFELIRYAFPFFLLLVLATALVTIFPEIVLYLPEAMR